MQLNRRFRVPVDQQRRIATLQSDREALEKMFYLESSFLPPAASVLTGNFLKEFCGIFVPSAEGLDYQGLKEDALGSAVVEVRAAFGRLPHFDGSARDVGSAMQNRLLSGRDDADVERNLPSVHPIFHEHVGRARSRAGNKPRHFFRRIEGGVLSFREDAVPNSIVAAAFHAVVVPAVNGVVA